MRQGRGGAEGQVDGRSAGWRESPDALILPDPATRFARTAARLDALSVGHPMAEWLRFMARLAGAQHAVAGTAAPFVEPDQKAVEQAVEARMPPLAADGHGRDPSWRDGLVLLLDGADDRAMPAPARSAIASLRTAAPKEWKPWRMTSSAAA